MTNLHGDEIPALLRKMGVASDKEEVTYTQYLHEEDQAPYLVFEITHGEKRYVLKQAKAYEASVYAAFFNGASSYVPRVYAVEPWQNAQYILMEYLEGENLQNCHRQQLKLTLDALIDMQNAYWGSVLTEQGYPYEDSLRQRKERRAYLNDPELERAYDRFLECYTSVPRTLCHDDLLPFNVIVSKERAAMIDWEYGGILPYPVSLARLIAHGREDAQSLFFMTQEDKDFAIQYYYEHLICDKGIPYKEYRSTLDHFLFYEYCEWVYVGNKYHATDGAYFKYYLPLAKRMAKEL